MKIYRQILIVPVLVLLMAVAGFADRTETATEMIDIEDATELEVQIDFGAGTINIDPSDMKEAAKLKVFYEPRYVRYDIDYSVHSGTGRLFLESDLRRSRHVGSIDNEWELALSTRYPLRLEMDIGACEADIDLGGLRLVELQIDVGAADARIDFSEPNPERLEFLDIDCGASSLEIIGLAEARPSRISIDIGAGSCELDLRGELIGEVELDADVGVGSIDIAVSRGQALRVEGDDDWFSSIDFHGIDIDEVRNGVWETEDYDDADDRLLIMVDVAMGSIDIRARR